MPTALHIDGVEYAYGERQALRGVSFDVGAGQLYGLVGPNGGGKTTLFRILSTQLVPQKGRVTVLGADVVGAPAIVRRRLGVVFQSPALDKKLTVRENLWGQGLLYGLYGKALNLAVDEALDHLNLKDRSKERVEKLSGGLMRRVEIAKGLLHSPQVLLLDEPTVGLDPLMRKELWDHVRSLIAAKGMTVLLTTHLLDEAEGCDALALVDQGKIVASGSPHELRSSLGPSAISLQTEDPEALSRTLAAKLAFPVSVVGNTVRISGTPPAGLAAQLFEELGGAIQSASIGKPTLEDLFIQKTGRRLSEGGVHA